jgi:3-phenylpropionate/trans-cinnamate dioxygenase ferredoxin reductase subunit
MEVAGLPDPGSYDDVIYPGDKDSLEFIAFWLADRIVVAGVAPATPRLRRAAP